ncbi:MAG: hypothetical protein P0Y48_08655 [Candidatus Microbacterium phytovorans]|uniref:Uncharacterized protein n=1 Tax=Candidatus Microbacterium phytovorans TaxID=3121374 RepID=A0AAJ6B306_9MICO|nr:hypothetical protein [Microbacterium sp.]WEK12547.1 MAG: hypothetical protein P0Y48_08655 [Microbacterium sp.]
MKRLTTVVATIALTVALAGGVTTAASATTPTATPAPVAAATKAPVTIAKLPTKKVAKGKTVTVKPSVKTSGSDVKVISKRITATKKGVNLKNKTSVKLKAGTYKVTQTVKYQVKQTKKITFEQYEVTIPDCQILDVISEDSVEARLRIACKAYDLPGTQKFTVDVEWMYCSWSAYLDSECTASEYLDDAEWWEGQTTDGAWTFESFSTTYDDDEDYITPKKGEKFGAMMQYMGEEPVTLTGKVWSKTRTETRTQTLKVITRK